MQHCGANATAPSWRAAHRTQAHASVPAPGCGIRAGARSQLIEFFAKIIGTWIADARRRGFEAGLRGPAGGTSHFESDENYQAACRRRRGDARAGRERRRAARRSDARRRRRRPRRMCCESSVCCLAPASPGAGAGAARRGEQRAAAGIPGDQGLEGAAAGGHGRRSVCQSAAPAAARIPRGGRTARALRRGIDRTAPRSCIAASR